MNNLSRLDEQQLRTFAHGNAALIGCVIGPEAEAAHEEDNFIAEAFSIAMFLDFAKSLAAILGGAVTITKVIDSIGQLFKWARAKRDSKPEGQTPVPPLAERTLILIFEAYVNRKAGLREEALFTLLGTTSDLLTPTLNRLQQHGVIRQTRDGVWKYVRATA
jgi:hypothetical protein